MDLPPNAPSHPSRSSQSPELSSLCCAAAAHELSISHAAVYQCQRYSLFVPPSPSLTVSTCQFSVSASLFLPCK